MNRLISIGLSIAVAPAILLAIGQWIESPDTIIVSEAALFRIALPLGAGLVIAGLGLSAARGLRKFAMPVKNPGKESSAHGSAENHSLNPAREELPESDSPGSPAVPPGGGDRAFVAERPDHPAKKWLYFAIVLGILKTLVVATMYIDGAKPADVVPLGFAGVAVLWWLAVMVNRQKNWARYALLLIAVANAPLVIRALMTYSNGVYQLVRIAESIALIGGVAILFGRQYQEWFADPALAGTSGTYVVVEADDAASAAVIENPDLPASGLPESPSTQEDQAGAESDRHGWSFWQWAITFCLVFFVVQTGGTKTHNPNDQNFLYVVIALQTLIGAVLVRVFLGIFSNRRVSSIFFKIILALALCVPLFGLSMCSYMAQHRWGGY